MMHTTRAIVDNDHGCFVTNLSDTKKDWYKHHPLYRHTRSMLVEKGKHKMVDKYIQIQDKKV